MSKIIGGTASTSMLIPDWEQTNPNRADYIKNKPSKLANAITGTATGNGVVQLDKVSPIEHELAVQLESPDITDFSGVSIARYGRNLFDLDWFEANLASGRWHYVEFNGRRCIKNTPNSDCMFIGYATKSFPVPIMALQIDAYCAEGTPTVLNLYDKQGNTLAYASVSNDINNWTKRWVFGSADVGSYMLYCSSPYDVYIDLDSLIAVTDTNTEPYEPFVSQTATANADGTVDGIMSVAPTSVLTAEGVTINAEYNMDTNAVLESLPTGGGTSITIDKTLSKEGQAADAKTVGEALNSIGAQFGQIITEVVAPQLTPDVTAEDNGKILQVVDGEWAAVSLLTAENTAF